MLVAGGKDPGRAFLSGRAPAIGYWIKCRLELRTLVEHSLGAPVSLDLKESRRAYSIGV